MTPTSEQRAILAAALRVALDEWARDLRWAHGCAPATVAERERRSAVALAMLIELTGAAQ